MPQEFAYPLAYFITFTCYGTWLHGNKEMSVDRGNNNYLAPYVKNNPFRTEIELKNMSEIPYFLDSKLKRSIVLTAIREVCDYKKWSLLAAHIRINHIHLVLHGNQPPEIILNTIKAYASRKLNLPMKFEKKIKKWTRHGSTRYLWKNEEVESCIQYVISEQGTPLAVYENKERKFLTSI